ncbi:MAG: ABC transporter substrate-binding protein [Alphaproteobacteria bacterium]|nr:ABC transporter substrate-binding protein [Alphaproteobacteria bacterium]
MFSRRSFLTGAAGLAAPALLAARALAQTRTVIDALDRQVEVPAAVDRVVVMFNYEEFTAVAGPAAWAKVVGISRAPWASWRPAIFARYSAAIPNLETMPDVGHTDDGTFSAEKVIALRPDIVFMAEWSFTALAAARAQMAAAGIPVVVIDYNAQTLERHLASTRALGAVMGTSERAETLAALYQGEFADILRRVGDGGGRKPKVYFELAQAGAGTIGNSYRGTMWGKVATTLGAENLADGRIPGPWGPIAAEAVLAANPDFIFMCGSSWVNRPNAVRTGYDVDAETTRRGLAPYAARPGWGGLAAIRNGEIHAIEHGLGRSLLDFTAMQYIAKRLYPERFADVDPIRSLRAYHDRFLPVAFSGTWMLPLRP